MKIARKTKEKENSGENFLLKSPIRKDYKKKQKFLKYPLTNKRGGAIFKP